MAAFPSREVLNTFDQRWFFEQSLLQPEILKQGPSRREKSASNPSTTSRILQGPTANDVAEKSRRIGDLAVYKYYLAAIGWKLCWVVVAVAIVYMVSQRFPRMQHIFLALIPNLLTHSLALWLIWYADGAVALHFSLPSMPFLLSWLSYLQEQCYGGCYTDRISTTHLTKFQDLLQ